MTSRRVKRPKYEKPSKRLPGGALMTAYFVENGSTLFFRLPLELRDRIYDELWKGSKVVAVVQRSSKIDIRAFYEARDVRARHQEFGRHRPYQGVELQSVAARQAQLSQYLRRFQFLPGSPSLIRQHLEQRPMGSTHLPEWLLVSKLFLREAMARFSHRSHWLLRPISRAGPYKPLPVMTLMVPGLAPSLSLGEWSFECSPSHETLLRRNATALTMRFSESDVNWLTNLADYLQEQNQVKFLKFTIVHPEWYSESKLQVTLELAPIARLLSSLTRLQTLEIQLRRVPAQLPNTKPGKYWPHSKSLVAQLCDVLRPVVGTYTIDFSILSQRVDAQDLRIKYTRATAV